MRRLSAAVLFLVVACADDGAAWADGEWGAITIDGRRVAPGSFNVSVRNGQITGGRDGCNNWGYVEDQPPASDGSRMIVSDAQGCPETAEQRGYRIAIGMGTPGLAKVPDGNLRIFAGGHEIVARRIKD